MTEILETAVGFPTVPFTSALVVVIGFWLLVLLGFADRNDFDTDLDAAALGLEGVPVSVSASLLIVLGWFLSLSGSVLLGRENPQGSVFHLLQFALLFASLFLSWCLTRALVRPLARFLPGEPALSRRDFVGLTCTIRPGRMDTDSGRTGVVAAEVVAEDGSAAIVPVRRSGSGRTPAPGSTGLLCAYDEAGEFYWVEPCASASGPVEDTASSTDRTASLTDSGADCSSTGRGHPASPAPRSPRSTALDHR
ncbi:hypothetical protein [Streptomyces sp. NPDC048639]|uniref:hypothetical protein n=1 Tax=Streptomyces sp. NPDC048639 TaxID=3365581 RepID=UPI00371A529D